MTTAAPFPPRPIDADLALRTIAQATAAQTGEPFFRALVENLARTLDTVGAWVTEYFPQRRTLRAMAFWMNGQWVNDFETVIDGTPCEQVVLTKALVHIPDRIADYFPVHPDFVAAGTVAYMGVPLLDDDNTVVGHLAVIDARPIPADDRLLDVFQIFAARAAAEVKCLAATARLREREEKLARLVDTAMDAILDLDAELTITAANPPAARVFGCPPERLIGRPFTELLTTPAARTFLRHADALAASPDGGGALWLPDPLDARRLSGELFVAEASLSRYTLRGRACHTLILRDVNDRLEAQRTIQSLAAQADYLKGELRDLQNADLILGNSPAMRGVLRDVAQVAPTDAAVLILGETGTGKELIANAIHAGSRRKDKPLIRVNCAAIPANLMESEFFGHEKGAFTGATQRRDGRFLLADGGTLFLDEVGELPVDLQVKLLRALQEGEFEPVGGTKTVKVNVRVVAATNRDLSQAIKSGAFREDLYYRLNVFPLRVPALRDRSDEDLALLARAFTARAAHRVGRPVELTDADLQRLRAYAWPGNVRELENVIERAVITAVGGRLNLDRALPETAASAAASAFALASSSSPNASLAPTNVDAPPRIRTVAEFEVLERENICRALDAAHGRIAGDGGAAQLLAINPSTLRSRIKALQIHRPADLA